MKFQFLTQYPEDYLLHPAVFSLIYILHEFAAFAYGVINRFISITT